MLAVHPVLLLPTQNLPISQLHLLPCLLVVNFLAAKAKNMTFIRCQGGDLVVSDCDHFDAVIVFEATSCLTLYIRAESALRQKLCVSYGSLSVERGMHGLYTAERHTHSDRGGSSGGSMPQCPT